MNQTKEQIFNIPNLVSFIRILMAPVLFYFALTQQPYWFIGTLLFAVFTDVLDGFLARTLKQITEMGAHLDSWGDFVIYSTMAICAWILWPDIVQREILYFTATSRTRALWKSATGGRSECRVAPGYPSPNS